MKPSFVLPMLMLSLLSGAPSVYAAHDQDRAAREAMRRAQLQVHQAEEQKAQLEEEKAKLRQELETARKEIGKQKTGVAAERRKRLAVEKDLQGARDEVSKLQQKSQNLEKSLAELTAKQADTSRRLAETEAEKKRAEETITARDKAIAASEDRNAKLYSYGREIMVKYEKKTCSDALSQAEPFTGLKKVEIENLLETYRDKVDEQRIRSSSAVSGAPRNR